MYHARKSHKLREWHEFCAWAAALPYAEKALKAAVANSTNEAPPKTHDLPKLADKTDIYEGMPQEYKKLLNKLTPLQIEARYPEYKEKLTALLTENYCAILLGETEGFLCWIKEKLGK